MHAPIRRSVAAAGLAALLLLGAACGGDDEPDATVTGAESTTTAADTPEAPDDTTADTTAATDDTVTDDTVTDDTVTDDTTPPGEPVPACDLLTADDAADALGEDVVEGFVQETDECEWMTADELRTVQVARLDEEPDEWEASREAGGFEPVEGLGDAAYYGSVFSDLSFLVGDEVYEVDVELRGDGDALEITTALAETVLSRL